MAHTRRTEELSTQKSKRVKKALGVGDNVPKVTLKNQDGEDVPIGDLGGIVVVFSYPKASTPGCTKQAKGFGELYEKFKDIGAKVFGLSADSERAQTTFKNKLKLNFALLSDPSYELIEPLGAKKTPKGVIRSHWVFRDGEIVFAEVGVSPAASPEVSLDAATSAYNKIKEEGGEASSEDASNSKDELKSKVDGSDSTSEPEKVEPAEDKGPENKTESDSTKSTMKKTT